MGFGWVFTRKIPVAFDIKRNEMKIPGSYMNLCLILAIFATKYAFGYLMATDPLLTKTIFFTLLRLSVAGFCAGILLGRFSCYLFRKAVAEHKELPLAKEIASLEFK